MREGRKMIFITGDTHGDFRRLVRFCSAFHPSRKDVMIILGDAGFNYYGGWRDREAKQLVSALPLTVFSIHGNHEMRPAAIPSYHTADWHGGRVYAEDEFPNLLFAADGEIYDLDGTQAVVIGGAYSVDKHYRLARGWGWWPDEQPSDEVRKKVEAALAAVDWKVDTVLSHTVPLRYEPTEVFLPFIDQSRVDKSTEIWLDSIERRLAYRRWYAGHYHTEKEIDRLTLLFESIRVFPSSSGTEE